MGGGTTWQWQSLERTRSTLFLAAAGLLFVYASLNGLAASGQGYALLEDVVGPAGFAVGFVGLVGMYPSLADRSPLLAPLGAGCAALGAVGFTAIAGVSAAQLAGVAPPSWAGFLLVPAAIGMLVGYPAVSIASVRAGVPARTAALFALPAVIFAVMLAQAALYVQSGLFSATTVQWSAVAISTGQAVGHLAIGYTLRRDGTSTDRAHPTGEPATG